jgi:hypothetical protein
MLRYHLARVFRPALLLVLLVVVFLSINGYRQGGTEDVFGGEFGYFFVLRYWGTMAPLLLLGLAASTPIAAFGRHEHDPFVMTRPSIRTAVWDGLARWIALLTPVALSGLLASFFLMSRLSQTGNTFVYLVQERDPVNVGAIWLVFVLGPLLGSAVLLAIGEVFGTLLKSTALRVVVIGVIALMDAVNRLVNPWLSPSSTSLSMLSKACQTCGPRTPLTPITSADPGTFWTQPAMWGQYVYREVVDGGIVPEQGPFTVEPASELVVARLTLLVIAIAIMVGVSVWRGRRLQRALEK